MRQVPARDRRGTRDWWGDSARRATPRLGAVRRPARRGRGRRGAVAVRLAPEGATVATFWPAAGLAIIALALAPARAVAAAHGGASSSRSSPPTRSAAAGSGSASPTRCVETLATYRRRAGADPRSRTRRPDLHDQEDFVRLLGAAVLSGGLVVAGGVARRADRHSRPDADLAGHGVHRARGRRPAAGAAGARHREPVGGRPPRARRADRAADRRQRAHLRARARAPALTFAPVLFLAWAALRFDLRVACAELALFGIFVTAQTVRGGGPFGDAVDQRPDQQRWPAPRWRRATWPVPHCWCCRSASRSSATRCCWTGSPPTASCSAATSPSRWSGMAFLEPDETGRRPGDRRPQRDRARDPRRHRGRLLGLRLTELMDIGPDYEEALPQLLAGTLDGWRVEGPLTFARTGQVTLQISSLGESGDEPFFAAQLLDVTAEHEARHGLEAAQTLTNATLDTTNCIIMVTDLEGIVVRVNAATSVITGYREDELLGRKVWDTGITPSDADDVEAAVHVAQPLRRTDHPRERRPDQDRREAADRLEHQHRPRRARQRDVRRDDRHRRHRRADHGRAGQPPDGGLAHHRDRRHRHRRADQRGQLRYPAPAGLRARRAGRRAVPPAAQVLGAARAHRRGHPRRGLRHPGARPRVATARPGRGTGPG